jgi:hypothetical protein
VPLQTENELPGYKKMHQLDLCLGLGSPRTMLSRLQLSKVFA